MDYLHGFDKKEQQRLIHQAKFLEPYVYDGVNFKNCRRLLEVGCGVGAQSQILLKRFPKTCITGIDFSNDQLTSAAFNLKSKLKSGRIELLQQDAQKLNLDFKKYDAAFLCWFLEHVPDPLQVLKHVHKHLKPGAEIVLTEVFNQSLFMEPYSPAYIKYWFEFNDLQWTMKGHPFVGAQLGHLLKEAGFKSINVEFRPLHFDSRKPKLRTAFIDYFFDILLSAEPKLLQHKKVTPELITQMRAEVELAKKAQDSVFFYSFARATAVR
jgi:ubiquinone/menaquinone biosynthesis C-methylase UbiE